MTVNKTIKAVVLATLAASIVLCAFIGLSAYGTHRNAIARLNEFKGLGASTNPTASFESLRLKYGSEMHTVHGCTQQFCQYETSLSNESISKLHIVPYTEMNIWFTVHEGILQLAMLEYRTALTGSHSPVVHIQQGLCVQGCSVRFDVNPHGSTPQIWNGFVEFNTRATTQQRDAALAINLECLARIGGCKDIVDLLPTVWARNAPGTISSQLIGLSQRLEASHGFPSSDDF